MMEVDETFLNHLLISEDPRFFSSIILGNHKTTSRAICYKPEITSDAESKENRNNGSILWNRTTITVEEKGANLTSMLKY